MNPVTPGTFTPRPSRLTTLRTCCFRFASPDDRVRLATERNSPARYSKRTAQPLRAVPYYPYNVSGSLNSLSRVLFTFPSRYSFAIGLSTYLALEVDASHIPDPSPGAGTLEPTRAFLGYPYGAITLYGMSFQTTSGFQGRALPLKEELAQTPHPRLLSQPRSVCAVRCSLAVTNRIPVGFFSSGY